MLPLILILGGALGLVLIFAFALHSSRGRTTSGGDGDRYPAWLYASGGSEFSGSSGGDCSDGSGGGDCGGGGDGGGGGD